ncbi:CusA/CzcA family heavy metal efflux RND transporter [Panacibacter ginsenosidivorans]|uniref:CusA/CzcA family heavy metal efflux RND transporter n=1 Tax=Panacibacter ginsenosidivorans TaxID=1813871 RepID=A0A5B8VH76_9BACT|nr:CusA/CzcA family heavy metal efflux RND transporter [Panacibacter ginsenosidivorans]QEC69936.1 CusA/CzcA family heavy metal efflux RND transporter [Panacibacter ginsenosidivorans]
MLHAIIHFSIKNKLIIGLFVLGLISWGAYSVTQLPIDAVPDITNNQVLVITAAPSLGAPDVERFITVPVEQATRNVPGIIEQRSFSRFGLSLVTIVFDDKTDVYWARQQVSERLTQVRQQIPAGMGEPELGPVTTGLGEIFQYVVKAKPGYEGKYDLAALRDIQDWIVRRQLLGTPGVADVSSFGGLVKQYEVAINPDKLKNFQLTIADVYKALQDNNQNTGGAYIEKGPGVLYIRSEGLVESLDDIGSIVVKQVHSSVPVLVRDVAEVKMGSAIRYGATVFNDEGEVAGAVVMMLKGANSNEVIKSIKAKITEIEKTLPEGVMIEPFLDRTKMVNNAISTVEKNLMEGALIVIFVLVLFLGNLRAGLIVASVIPLSMLFAIIMMNLFGVSGNLMSLGAIDFGLLVDGAVIIVEAVMHKLSHSKMYAHSVKISQDRMDEEVRHSAGTMMNSAVFGQIIILIVYLPILSLQGIEGKMFKPMAETVSFAIIGAFILSLTYVPMISALFISKKLNHKNTFADKMIAKLQSWYQPVLKRAMRIPAAIVITAFSLFAIAVFVLTTLGGEFIPQLEEGDFAVDTRLLTGSSLSNTINTTEKAARVLLDKFPEVEKVVSKIGSGEIPTDPMPLEAADMMVILKDKKEWTSAESFPELANKMSDALQEVPGIATGFQFPVQMRFNELMTGARQDVVCKIFGDDLDTLAHYSDELAKVINSVEGAKDLYKETVTGIPQLVITYNREAIARYGASITDINNTIQSAYAGAVAGLVFEADRRYDLVIRMNEKQKKNADEIGNLLIGLPNGTQVPLYILANVEMKDGPCQIQREDARRRISAGFNVRGRDVQSIVTELQEKVSKQINFPAGYYITYGGQYENLQHATRRLSIALPVALLLILLMLFFAFKKLKYCLLIFSAIPLSAIGGVFALWLRDMPFSISAGIGFIALFGVAVLNGIVLISEMNRLKAEGYNDINEIIMHATKTRLRPVLMTAAVASLGFLPMALSNGAGAEVQRPLATVVIGGLITATLLTLFVLPALYMLFEKGLKPKTPVIVTTVLLFVSLIPSFADAQQMQSLSLEQAIGIAKQQNKQLQLSKLNEQYYAALKTAGVDVPKTQFSAELGQINSTSFDNRFAIQQSFAMPAVYNRQRSVLEQEFQNTKAQTSLQQTQIIKLVKYAYLQLQFIDAKEKLLQRTDSIFARYQQVAKLRFEKGESNLLEKISLDNQSQQVRMQLQMLQSDKRMAQAELAVLLDTTADIQATDVLNDASVLFDSSTLSRHPFLYYYEQQQKIAAAQTLFEKAKLQPDLLLGYYNQSVIGYQMSKDRTETYYDGGKRFSAVQIGIGIPIFNKAQKSRIKAAAQKEIITHASTELAKQQLDLNLQQQWNEYIKYQQAVQYFKTSALTQSEIIIKTANLSYKNGEINYIEWGTLIGNAIGLQSQYLDALKALNNGRIELEYLLQPNEE